MRTVLLSNKVPRLAEGRACSQAPLSVVAALRRRARSSWLAVASSESLWRSARGESQAFCWLRDSTAGIASSPALASQSAIEWSSSSVITEA